MPAKGQLSGYHIKCEVCGKEIYQTKTQYNRAQHHFCSNQCQKIFQHNQAYENRKCEICDAIFHISKKSTQRFCSTECQKKWQTTRTGKLNPKTKRIKCCCDNCQTPIEIIPFNYKRFQYHFCGNECRQKWYSQVFSQNPSWKEESRKRAAEMLKKNSYKTNTKPQIIINNLLDSLKIPYRNEETFVYYSIDNFLYSYDLIIEVMGDFWHCNPTKYTNIEHFIQSRVVSRDKAKNTYIDKYYHIKILYLWESDIYNRLEVCEKLITMYIEQNGQLSNYHSFNYLINNGKLEIQNKIIIPFQQRKIQRNA